MVTDLDSVTAADRKREIVHQDACIIGLRPAARKHGIPERTVLTWSHRYKWKLPECLKTLRWNRERRNQAEISATRVNALAASIDEHGEHSRLYLSAATLQAAHDLAQRGGKTEGERVPYSGLLNTSRAGDTVHGWQAQRTAAPTVQIANVILPTPQEEAQRIATDRKLDALMARLNAASKPSLQSHPAPEAAGG